MKFHRQVFIVSYFLKVRSGISQFSKPDNIWTYNVIKHLKIINFRSPLSFTWITIEPFIFMQLAHLGVYAMINIAHWQNKNIVKMRIVVVKMLNNWMILWSFSLSPWFAEKLEFGVHSEISLGVSHISIFVRNAS